MSLKDRLKEARTEANLTQQALADLACVGQSTIGLLESGERKTARKVSEIAAVLRVEPLWLSTGKGPKRTDGTKRDVGPVLSPLVLALAQKLALVPKEKLRAVSLLLDTEL
ncbi:helix-turn-helix domain-containing protein [Massilia jejuensis]|uniref:Helix-turn-helix domain-containing protein n=1 Tax=Massilia jejuensis TaxID=648894 RepID=A0ABW0PQ85_9BURK